MDYKEIALVLGLIAILFRHAYKQGKLIEFVQDELYKTRGGLERDVDKQCTRYLKERLNIERRRNKKLRTRVYLLEKPNLIKKPKLP